MTEEQLQKFYAMAEPRSENAIRKAEERKMKRKDKELLLRDLCARLPYGVIMTNIELPETHYPLTCGDLHDAMFDNDWNDVPYLRPMSDMTEEEEKEYNLLANRCMCTTVGFIHLEAEPLLDWLNKKMFDFRGLIPKDLALSTDKYNPYKD